MGFLRISLVISLAVLGFGIAVQWYLEIENVKNLNRIEKWADENKINLDKNLDVEKFNIKYDQHEWDDLIMKLNHTRYFESVDAIHFDFGFSVDYAKELVDYWMNKFNWKKQVDILNKYQSYKIRINSDVNLHFIRVNDDFRQDAKRVPILLLNGWPSTFYEFYEMIDYLRKTYNNNNNNRYFDIIVPSIPGYAYSTPLKKIFDTVDIALVYDALMRHLFGDDCNYFVHGEDWGAAIAYNLGILYPRRVKGLHLSMASPTLSITKRTLLTSIITEIFPSFMLTDEERASNFTFSLLKRFSKLTRAAGYFYHQATKPDTLGFGLTDSPVGLMTYILEKYAFGSFSKDIIGIKDGKLSELSRDDLLTIVTIYWMTNSITSSMRLYRNLVYQLTDNWPKNEISKYSTPISVPVAFISFPYEIDHTPYAVLRKIYGNLKQYSIMKSGGHFAAFLQPQLTTDDFIKFIDSI